MQEAFEKLTLNNVIILYKILGYKSKEYNWADFSKRLKFTCLKQTFLDDVPKEIKKNLQKHIDRYNPFLFKIFGRELSMLDWINHFGYEFIINLTFRNMWNLAKHFDFEFSKGGIRKNKKELQKILCDYFYFKKF